MPGRQSRPDPQGVHRLLDPPRGGSGAGAAAPHRGSDPDPGRRASGPRLFPDAGHDSRHGALALATTRRVHRRDSIMPANHGPRAGLVLALTMILAAALAPGRARGDDGAAPAAPAAPAQPAATAAANGPAPASPVSATGLLPIFGVGIDFEADKAKPEEAVASMHKLWDGYLK